VIHDASWSMCESGLIFSGGAHEQHNTREDV
jgi:hypothetical protein